MKLLLQVLDESVKTHNFQDYVLSKARLDDIYVEMIKYKPAVTATN